MDMKQYDEILKEASKSSYIIDYEYVEINKQSLKIDTELAIALTEGYHKNGKKVRICIMASHIGATALGTKEMPFEIYPKLITHNSIKKTPGNTPVSGIKNRPLSDCGGMVLKEHILWDHELGLDPFTHKYVAFLVTKHYIRNSRTVWEKICNSHVFGIFKPGAPFENIKKYEDEECMILFFRVYELDEEYPSHEIMTNGVHSHKINNCDDYSIVSIKQAVIDDDQCFKDQKILDDILINSNALIRKEIFINNITYDEDGDPTLNVKTVNVDFD